jgi:TRAP-type C4-dicarboxylate transport system permease small subunit
MIRFIDRLSAGLALFAGTLVLLLAFFICVDVVARRFFGFSMQGSDELGGYVLALVGALGFAYVLAERGFTRIDLALPYMPVPVQRLLHVLAYLTLAAFALFMAWYAVAEFKETWLFDSRAATPLQTPLWVPQGLWLAGILIFASSATLHALRAIHHLLMAPESLDRRYGARTVADELEEYQSQRRTAPPPASLD